MKVLIVTGIFPPDKGGPASYLSSFSKSLLDNQVEVVSIITLAENTDECSNSHGAFIPLIKIKRSIFWPVRAVYTVFKIFQESLNADVVYLNGLVLEGVIATKVLSKKPIVIKVVGDLVWEKARNSQKYSKSLDSFQSARLSLLWRLLRKIQSIYTAKADLIITPSTYLKSVVEGWGIPAKKIAVIYNSIEAKKNTGKKNKSPEFDFISVSRLVPWKGLDALISLSAKNNWKLRIVGDGPLRKELEAFALRENALVSFSGGVDHAKVFAEISNSKVFVLNSSYEGLPHIVLEAKVAGTAVIATDAGGTKETINHMVDGLIVPVDDKTRLESAIKMLLDNDELRSELVKNASNQLTQMFSYNTMVEETINALKLVANKSVVSL